jgi:hypothetical protein
MLSLYLEVILQIDGNESRIARQVIEVSRLGEQFIK